MALDVHHAKAIVDDAIRGRVRASGKTNVTRAVSEPVRVCLRKRRYEIL
ncbi:hypothetical protein [Sphingobium sp. SCG-1]|nr:hypothetical protein [Sphingobium sp. SCG-1]